MYQLDFTKDSANVLETKPEDRYAVCYQAVTTSREAAPFEQWDDAISLLKKLKAIGREEKVEGAPLSLKTYVLTSGGGILDLERAERTILLEHIKKAQWNISFLENARNTYKWIEKMPEAESVKESRPRAVK